MRTRHVVVDENGQSKPKYTNALAKETSPYLLQHAHNPVDWRAWNSSSLDEAKKSDKPIFLSIGYSTCHWCHVMEEESFEDEEIARAINEGFVPIKVDREERPDVDGIYMTAVQALTGHGGWPMSCFLTPDGKPFFAGTYFPARDGDRGSNIGFLTIVRRLTEAWQKDRARVASSADEITGELAQLMRAPAAVKDMPGVDVVDRAIEFFESRYDDAWGGMLPAPKFPSSLPLRVLLRHHARTGDARSLEMATTSFHKMADGGLCDQVGGGFHRYSTDERWLVPHFEKMLYDNALLVVAGLELFQVTHDKRIERVIRDVLHYVERDMTSSTGAFFSATDADSLSPEGKREEGWYFTWTVDELKAELEPTLGKDKTQTVLKAWAVSPRGNFEGRSILWRPKPNEIGDDVERVLDEARPILLQARNERPKPLRDDKILAAWNGLMISAFARASFVLDEPKYAALASRAARFVLDQMRAHDGRLHRSFKEGSGARLPGNLDDHAFVIAALIDLFEATGEKRFLDDAVALEKVVAQHFEDQERGGFYLSADDAETLLAREKPAHDGAEPSGNSVHALNLARLSAIVDDETLRARAVKTVRAFGQVLARHPAAMAELLIAIEMLHATPQEIVVVTKGTVDAARALLAPIRASFDATRVIVQVREQDAASLKLSEGRVAVDGKPTVYVCERRACKLPATSVDDVERALA